MNNQDKDDLKKYISTMPVEFLNFGTAQNNLKVPVPKVDKTKKVRRLRAGQVPDFAKNGDDDSDVSEEDNKKQEEDDDDDGQKEENIILEFAIDRGKNATQPFKKANTVFESSDLTMTKEKKINVANPSFVKVINTNIKSNTEIDSQNGNLMHKQEDINESSSGSESDSGIDDDDDDDDEALLLKPTFVPRLKRTTIQEKEERDIQAEAAQSRRVEEDKQRKVESRKLAQESHERMLAAAAEEQYDSEIDIPDDTDPLEDTEAWELVEAAWRLREKARLLRDAKEAHNRKQEETEKARRRQLTDEQLMAENDNSNSYINDESMNNSKSKRGFLQKYYHRGAFYMDEDTLAKGKSEAEGEADKSGMDVRMKAHEYASAATGDDKFNKAAMPSVMQVKNFGRKGGTKYKGLVGEDTTYNGGGSLLGNDIKYSKRK